MTIFVSNGINIEITQEELCSKNKSNPFTHFRVEAAFKYRQFLGIVGLMWKKDDPEYNSTVALRVLYWHQPDPSGKSPNNYYEAKIWNEFREIDSKKRIRHAFTTRAVNVFGSSQKNYELVFLVQVCPPFEHKLTSIESLGRKPYDCLSVGLQESQRYE